MGGFSNRKNNSSGSPKTPAIVPTVIQEEEDPVPIYFLDEPDNYDEYAAGIEQDYTPSFESTEMGSTLSSLVMTKDKMRHLASAMRKPANSSSSGMSDSAPATKLKKLVRFLDRVEIVPAPESFYSAPKEDRGNHGAVAQSKKQKISRSKAKKKPSSQYYDTIEEEDEIEIQDVRYPSPPPEVDIGIASGLGRAGSPSSPTRSPNRSPNSSSRDLTRAPEPQAYNGHLAAPPQQTPRIQLTTPPSSPPPSWRIPPESLQGRQPHVRTPPRVRSPTYADEEVDLRVNDHFGRRSRDSGVFVEEEEVAATIRPGVTYVRATSPPKPQFHPPPMHPVIARKMWPQGEVRFEDQWGRRLIPAGHKDSFRFDLWPVEEDVKHEGDGRGVRGAWVRGRDGYRVRSQN